MTPAPLADTWANSGRPEPESAPFRFLATSRGASATRWLSFCLASRPHVFVAHGKHALESIGKGDFNIERRQDDTASLALGNVMSDFYRCRPLGEVFDIYGYLQPGAQASGNVHTYTLEEVHSRFDPVADLRDIRVVNILRHPVTYIASHTAMALSARRYPALRRPLHGGFELALARHPELLLLEHNDAENFEAFVASCYGVALWVADLRQRSVPHVKMEEVTRDVDRLVWFCEYLTRLSYDRKRLAGLIEDGPINRHRKASELVTPHKVYCQWQAWQRTAAAHILPEELLELLEVEGYDVTMLHDERRRTVSSAESSRPASGSRASVPASVTAGHAVPFEPPILVEQGYRGFNLVLHQERFFALSLTLGVVDFRKVDAEWYGIQVPAKTVFIGPSLLDVKRQVDESTSDQILEAVTLLQKQVQAAVEEQSDVDPASIAKSSA